MALAEYNHHAAPRRPTMARAREKESEMNSATGQKTLFPRVASSEYFTLDDDGDVLAARPLPLVEVRPGTDIWRSCWFIGSLIRGLRDLPSGLRRFGSL